MAAGKRLVKFVGGGALGTIIGLAIGSLLAPQSGEELQRQTRSLLDEARREGDRAKAETEQELVRRFRARVNDSEALSQRA